MASCPARDQITIGSSSLPTACFDAGGGGSTQVGGRLHTVGGVDLVDLQLEAARAAQLASVCSISSHAASREASSSARRSSEKRARTGDDVDRAGFDDHLTDGGDDVRKGVGRSP